MLSDAIQKVFIINLAHRTDRLASITKELERLYLSDRIERIEGLIVKAHNSGTAGIALSHRHCVALAKERGYPFAFILQDDAKCLVDEEEFTNYMNQFLDCSKEDTWMGLWLGSFFRSHSPAPGKNYLVPEWFNQDTATLIHARGYDLYMKYLTYCAEKFIETGDVRYNCDYLFHSLKEDDPIEQEFIPLKNGLRISNKKLFGQADNMSDRMFLVMHGGHGLSL